MNAAEELTEYRRLFGPLPQADTDSGDGTTHVLMIVDMSGSMHSLAEDVRGGFNTYITDLADKPGTYRITATLFDQRYLPLCVDASLADVPKLDHTNYMPAGSTALLDAVGRTVGEFETRAKPGEHDRVLVVIQTDGHENCSREWTYDKIRTLIKDREQTGRWSFVYLGAGADTWSQAQAMGVSHSSYVNTAATSTGTAASYSGLTRGTVAFAGGGDGASVSRSVANEPGATK